MSPNDPGLPTGAVRIVPTPFSFRVEIEMWYSSGEIRWERATIPVMIKEAVFNPRKPPPLKTNMSWWQKNRTPKKPKRKKKR